MQFRKLPKVSSMSATVTCVNKNRQIDKNLAKAEINMKDHYALSKKKKYERPL